MIKAESKENVDGEEEHGKGGHDEVGDSQVADQNGERRAQLLLELVRQKDQQVGGGADDHHGEQERAQADPSRGDGSNSS